MEICFVDSGLLPFLTSTYGLDLSPSSFWETSDNSEKKWDAMWLAARAYLCCDCWWCLRLSQSK